MYLIASSGFAMLIVLSILSRVMLSVVWGNRYRSISICLAGGFTFPPIVSPGILTIGSGSASFEATVRTATGGTSIFSKAPGTEAAVCGLSMTDKTDLVFSSFATPRVHWQRPGGNIQRLTKASEASFGFMPTFIYR